MEETKVYNDVDMSRQLVIGIFIGGAAAIGGAFIAKKVYSWRDRRDAKLLAKMAENTEEK